MKLFFRKTGSGSPLIILHGLYGSSDNWHSIAKHLSEKYTVYTIDQRNHGHSEFANSHSYNDMRNDLAVFLDTQNIKKATILGHSMGGKAAMWFAAKYPQKVEKLIIADIAPKNYLLAANNSQVNFHRNILQAMKNIDFSAVKSRKNVDLLLSQTITDTKIRQFLLKNITIDKETKQYQWQLNVNVLNNYLNEVIGGVNKKWFEHEMSISDFPVLFIRGMLSDYITDKDIPNIKKIFPKAQIIDIQNAGHWLHAEQPEKFIEAIFKR